MYECVNVSENVLCVCGVCVVCVVCVVGRRINKQNGRIEREREKDICITMYLYSFNLVYVHITQVHCIKWMVGAGEELVEEG